MGRNNGEEKKMENQNFYVSEFRGEGKEVDSTSTFYCPNVSSALLSLIEQNFPRAVFPLRFRIADEQGWLLGGLFEEDELAVQLLDGREVSSKTIEGSRKAWKYFRQQHLKGWKYLGGGTWTS